MLGPMHFYKNFRIIFSISTKIKKKKRLFGIFIVIALTPQMNLSWFGILKIADFLIHEQETSPAKAQRACVLDLKMSYRTMMLFFL